MPEGLRVLPGKGPFRRLRPQDTWSGQPVVGCWVAVNWEACSGVVGAVMTEHGKIILHFYLEVPSVLRRKQPVSTFII